MNHEFAILPWEYRGSGFDPTPHAITSHEVGGRQRDLLLKMRDGIIYFKAANRTPVFAIARQFDGNLQGKELIRAWRVEVERSNFGQFSWRWIGFKHCSTTVICVVITLPDLSSWVSDAHHISWFKTPPFSHGETANLWRYDAGRVARHAIDQARRFLLDRPLSDSELHLTQSRWVKGDKSELRRIFKLIAPLYIRGNSSSHLYISNFRATNIRSEGGMGTYFGPHSFAVWPQNLLASPAMPALAQLLNDHFIWHEFKWNKCTIYLDSPFKELETKWGESWRGNYNFTTPFIQLAASMITSHHERLELALELRDWLKDKASPRQIDKWFSQIPD